MALWQIEIYENRDDAAPSLREYIEALCMDDAIEQVKSAMGDSMRADVTVLAKAVLDTPDITTHRRDFTPIGPQSGNRHDDEIGIVTHIASTTTGEVEGTEPDDSKDTAAQTISSKVGAARGVSY